MAVASMEGRGERLRELEVYDHIREKTEGGAAVKNTRRPAVIFHLRGRGSVNISPGLPPLQLLGNLADLPQDQQRIGPADLPV